MWNLDNNEIAKRLKAKREETNLSARKFALTADIDPSQYAKIEKGELPITKKIAEKVAKQFKETVESILYGINVPHENLEVREPIDPYITQTIPNGKKRIPFYDAEASAGDMSLVEMTPISAPSGTIDVGDLLADSQAAIRIYGNSMLPNYPPGCVIGLNRVTKSFIEPGEVFVIETRERRLLKRLFYKNDDSDSDVITCYSDNIMKFEGGARHGKLAYPPFDLPKHEIINLFQVTGVIKRNTNSIIINR